MRSSEPLLHRVQRVLHVEDGMQQPLPSGGVSPADVPFHVVEPHYHAGHWFAVCRHPGCTFISTGLLTEAEARETVCEVEGLLAVGFFRRRQFLKR